MFAYKFIFHTQPQTTLHLFSTKPLQHDTTDNYVNKVGKALFFSLQHNLPNLPLPPPLIGYAIVRGEEVKTKVRMSVLINNIKAVKAEIDKAGIRALAHVSSTNQQQRVAAHIYYAIKSHNFDVIPSTDITHNYPLTFKHLGKATPLATYQDVYTVFGFLKPQLVVLLPLPFYSNTFFIPLLIKLWNKEQVKDVLLKQRVNKVNGIGPLLIPSHMFADRQYYNVNGEVQRFNEFPNTAEFKENRWFRVGFLNRVVDTFSFTDLSEAFNQFTPYFHALFPHV